MESDDPRSVDGCAGDGRRVRPASRPYALTDECFEAAGGDGLAALALAVDVTANGGELPLASAEVSQLTTWAQSGPKRPETVWLGSEGSSAQPVELSHLPPLPANPRHSSE